MDEIATLRPLTRFKPTGVRKRRGVTQDDSSFEIPGPLRTVEDLAVVP